MPEFLVMYARHRKYLYFFLALCVLGWQFTSYKPVFAGLLLGTSLSLFNLWLLVKRTKRFGDVMVNGGRMASLGMLTRMATAVFAVLMAMEYPEYIHLISVIIGLMTAYLVIMIDGFIKLFH
jgi:ATP synthase protein I